MPLTLVLGPANSAKAREVLGAYAAAAHRGALLVVPNAADVEHYARELAEHGAVLASVLTFGGLAEEIARRCGYADRRLTVLQRDQLVRRAVRAARLEMLRTAAATAGFPAAAGELIAELQRSLVSPEHFRTATGRWVATTGRARYADELSSIYESYAHELEQAGRVDRELFAWRALDALRRAPGRWGGDPVFFYGFDDLHPLQRDAVETLARVAGADVVVSLTYEAGRAALRARAEAVEELRPLAERVLELPGGDDYYEPRSRHVLHHLERHLFAAGTADERVEPGDAVKLLESAGELSEAELVAAEVIALGREGIAGEEIAIVHRSPQRLAPVLASVFRQYGLRLSVERRLPLTHTALGRALRALARCALLPSGESSAQDLLDYLRAPGVLARPDIADALELAVRSEGVSTAEEARRRADVRLGEIDALASAREPSRELGRQARRLLAAPSRAAAPVMGSEEELDAAACAAVVRALGELEELGVETAPGDLLALLERIEVVARTTVARAPLLTEPLAIRARRFRVVIVCGLDEGDFPRPAVPDPFLSDEQRRELAVAGLRLRERGDALERERYLFYSAVTRATARVVLSYRSSDEEGNLQLPSPFIADVAELLSDGWTDRRARRLLSDVVWPLDEAPTARERVRAEAAARAGARVGEWRSTRTLSARALAHVRHTEILSAGALETYADCPVKWLVERELRPRALEPESEAIVRGSFMHDVLEQVLHRLGRAVTPESLPEALVILDEVLGARSAGVSPLTPDALRRAALEAIAADLRRYLEHEARTGSAWDPLRLELRFGFAEEEESLGPLELGDGGTRVAVRGAIDRVDVDAAGRRAVVRDYKSGGARPEHQAGRWSSERRLQVALYMLAVRDLLGLDPVAGLYQPLRGRDLRARGIFLEDAEVGAELFEGDGRERDALEAELEDAARRAVELARRLRGGDVRPCPATCSREGCRYPGICRSG
jgi:ATP-dependent helicase/DNAse subunit B